MTTASPAVTGVWPGSTTAAPTAAGSSGSGDTLFATVLVREQLVGVVGPIVPILETREEWVALVVGFVVGLVIVFGFWCCWRSTSQRRRPSSDRRFRADLGMPEQQSSASFEMGAAARPVRSDINLSQQQQQFVSNSSQFVPQPASDQPQPRPWEVEQGSWNDDQPPPPPPR